MVALPVASIFEARTPFAVAQLIRAAQAAGTLDSSSIKVRPKEVAAPLSFSQQRLWFLDQLTPGSATYNMSHAIRIKGPLNECALGQALTAILERHEVLRTCFVEGPSGAEPRLLATASILRVVPPAIPPTSEQELKQAIKLEASRPFDLANDILLRAVLFRTGAEESILLFVIHHITWDAWSRITLDRELSDLYNSFVSEQPSSLTPLPIQYADYAYWERERLSGEFLYAEVELWKRRLVGCPWILNLRTDHPRPAIQTFRGAKMPFILGEDLVCNLHQITQREGITPYVTLLAAFTVLISAHTGQDDFCIASPFANREFPETEPLIGFFANTMVLRNQVSAQATFSELLASTSVVTRDAYAHQWMPFEKLVEILRPARDLSRMPLTQVNFRLQADSGSLPRLKDLDVSAIPLIDNDTAKFDIALEVAIAPGAVGYFEYNTDLFTASTVTQMALDYELLLNALISAPNQPVLSLEPVQAIVARRLSPRHRPVRLSPRRAVNSSVH